MTATLVCLLLAVTGIVGVQAIQRFRLAELAGDLDIVRRCDTRRDARIDAILARIDRLDADLTTLRGQLAARDALDAKALSDAAKRAVVDGLQCAVDTLTHSIETTSKA